MYCPVCDSVLVVACGASYCPSKKEQIKMTRDEAIKIAANNKLPIYHHSFINTLEALGLLKFDEVASPKQEVKQEISKPSVESFIKGYLQDWDMNLSTTKAAVIINDLLQKHYKIVDCDIYDIVDKKLFRHSKKRLDQW